MTPQQARATLSEAGTGVASLAGQVISGPLDLSGLDLGHIDLSNARIEGRLCARGTVFRGLCSLKRATLLSGLDLDGALFHGDLRLDGATVEGDVVGQRAEFRGVADFDQSRLGGLDLTRATAFGNLSLRGTRISGAARFRDAELYGGLWCEDVSFGGVTDFRGLEVHGRTLVRSTVFVRGAGVEAITSYGIRA